MKSQNDICLGYTLVQQFLCYDQISAVVLQPDFTVSTYVNVKITAINPVVAAPAIRKKEVMPVGLVLNDLSFDNGARFCAQVANFLNQFAYYLFIRFYFSHFMIIAC